MIYAGSKSALELALCALLVLLAGQPAWAMDRSSQVVFGLSGKVVRIADGDTLAIKVQAGRNITIRLSDMDTPELGDGGKRRKKGKGRPSQPGGKAAAASLRQLAGVGNIVSAECYEIDGYGRPVCHVFAGDLNLNLEQIQRGWGWLPERADWVRDPASRDAEARARAGRLGAWGLRGQVSPARWRKDCWQGGKCPGAE